VAKRTVIVSARIANAEEEKKTMKKNLISIYSYLFGKNFKYSLVEITSIVLLWHFYWNLNTDSMSTKEFFLVSVLVLCSAMLLTIVSVSLDKHIKKVQMKYLNNAVNVHRQINIDVQVGEDVTKEEIARIEDALIRVNDLLDKKSQ
jgi:hypothetical protein